VCHCSIYNLWRQVLEGFDGFIIGLAATPGKRTFGFFNQNLVMAYPHFANAFDHDLDGLPAFYDFGFILPGEPAFQNIRATIQKGEHSYDAVRDGIDHQSQGGKMALQLAIFFEQALQAGGKPLQFDDFGIGCFPLFINEKDSPLRWVRHRAFPRFAVMIENGTD